MAPKNSIFRQPGARHFQLVHRSQRDPLIHDPDASQHVLKAFERENAKRGKNRVELESILPPEEVEHDIQACVGEAALYGIYYDDTQYDYMQHLRPVGAQEDGVESILLEATSQKKKSKAPLDLQLPRTVFASSVELPRNYESQQAIPESIAGFKPDMDPHLRQTLDALDDDAFADDDLEDGFFTELVKDGERAIDEDPGFGFREDGLDGTDDNHGGQFVPTPRDDASWEERFAFFKKAQREEVAGQSDDEFASEVGDTLDGLPTISVLGGKKRRKNGTSQASGYSMSSSSMYRNEALQTLDERFDQFMLKEYNEETTSGEDSSDEAPALITARDDFEAMMNEFMTGYEILGKKLQPKFPGETGPDKLDVLRRSIRQDARTIKVQFDSEEEDNLVPIGVESKKDRWDCETILSTYSNLENHPRLIRARDDKPVPKIYLDPKTGFPTPERIDARKQKYQMTTHNMSEESDDDEDAVKASTRTVTRSRNESKEDKKMRKATVKAEKQVRRAAKKTLKEQFGAEIQAQKKSVEARINARTYRL